jgi:hypothetical protein
VPDNDIASTSHMAKTEGCCCRTPNVHLAATFAPHLLHITPGALRNSNTTLAHLARSSNDPVDSGLPRRRESRLPNTRATLRSFLTNIHATKSSLSLTQLLSRDAHYPSPSAINPNNTKQLS